ncbi:MAG: phosphatase PAP2 family protein [Promethearchaeota archaeon]
MDVATSSSIETLPSPHHELNSRDVWIIGTLTSVIVAIGLILIQLGFNESFYSENAILYSIFRIITELGGEYAYIVFFMVIYLSIDKKFAERLIFSFVITLHFTNFFKLTFQDPRPSTNTLETSFGFPSGHTTGSVSFWGYTLLNVQDFNKKSSKWLGGIFSGFVLIFVPLSRLVIGVHDLADVVGGFGLAGLLLLVYCYLEPKISAVGWSLGKKIGYGVILGSVLWIGCAAILAWIHPTALWEQVEDLAQSSGLIIGLSIAIPLEHKYIQYNPKTLQVGQKILTAIIGTIVGIGFYFGLKVLFGLLPDAWNPIMRGIRYILFVVMLVLSLPALFKRIFPQKKP